MTLYSPFTYPQANPAVGYSRPPIPATFVACAFSPKTWNPYSAVAYDRTEYWSDTAGSLTEAQVWNLLYGGQLSGSMSQENVVYEFWNGLTGTPFTAYTTGTGAAVGSYAGAETTGKVGVVLCNTGTLATGRAGFGTNLTSLLPSGLVLSAASMLYLPALSTSAQEFSVFMGFFNSITTLLQDNGAYFEYTRTKGMNWRMNTAKASSRTEQDTGVAVVAGSWVLLKVVLNGATSIATFFINGVPVGTINTNIPNVPANTFGFGCGILKTVGTGQAYLGSDFVSLSYAIPTEVKG